MDKYGLIGDNDERLREKITVGHFREGDVLLDIYFNADDNEGTMKIKRVGYTDGDKYERQISGLNKCADNKDGFLILYLMMVIIKDRN